jgi:flagellar biosynthesis/type III secretory pathway M-ring protein FliF/YscJ
MRDVDRQSAAWDLGWLRARVQGFSPSVLVRRPATRWVLVVVAVVGVSAAGYWAVSTVSSAGVRYVAAQRRFSSDDLIKVCRTLDKGRVAYRIDEQRRVEVSADQLDQADALVAQLDLGQHSIDEIRSESSRWPIFETPGEREEKKDLAREKILERLISQREGVVWCLVSIHRPRASWARQPSKPSAFVYLETEGNRSLPYQTIQSIPAILAGFEPELTPGSITVMDRRGVRYFDAGDPALGEGSRNRAREEELSEEILEKLDWIKGVRVQVQVSSPRAGVAAALGTGGTAVATPAGAAETRMSGQRESVKPGPEQGDSKGTVFVNKPAELESEPVPAMRRPPLGGERLVGEYASRSNPAPGKPAADREHEHGRVLVFVPSSFYLSSEIRADHREPSREELHAMTERTEKQIRAAVGLVLPERESWKVDVDTIPDRSSVSQSDVLASSSDPRRRLLDWGIVGAIGAAVSILAAAGSWIHMARRPARLPEPVVEPRRYHVEKASAPGPSERTRELIRSDPEAAASVLQRWVGQGGGVP